MTTKEILRVNLFPNARCVASGSQPNPKADVQSIGWNTAGHNSISLVNENNNGAFACWLIPVTAGSAYVVRCGILYASGNPARGPIVEIRDNDANGVSLASIGDTKPSQSEQVLRFTAKSDRVALIFRGAKDEAGKIGVEVWNPILELAETFDAAVAGGGSGSSPGTPCRDRNGIRRAGDAR